MSDILHSSSGPLRYSRTDSGGYKLIVEVDQGISDFHRAMIPKWHTVQRQMYPAHISVVRKEVPPRQELWGKYEGQMVDFQYSPIVHRGTVYWWLNVFSKQLEEIRVELGLPVDSKYTLPSDGFTKCFHCTLANSKHEII